MSEIWKDIPGYDGFYQVSNKERIRSYKTRGYLIKQNTPHMLAKFIKNGYNHVTTSHKGVVKSEKFSRLVANAFIPNPDNKPLVNHINGIKTDDRPVNLEWVTHKENVIHAYENGLISVAIGEGAGNSRLTENEVLEIRNAYRLGCFIQKELADAYDIGGTTVNDIINRKTWKHI